MSTPLTDSINALTIYANSITGESDTNLSDAVYSLASGYGQGDSFTPLKYIKVYPSLFYRASFDVDDGVFDFGGLAITSSAIQMFRQVSGIKNITIKNLTLQNQDVRSFFYFNNEVETVTFENCTFAPSGMNTFAKSNDSLTGIYGEIDFSNVTTANEFLYGNTALTHIEIKANSIGISTDSWNYSPFDNETLVNIANALNPNVTGCTVTLSSDCVSRCSTITGTVTDGTFTADDSGSVTLADFITNTKGWTLA